MRKKGNPGVYIIQNMLNNKVYVGASKDTYNRICDHKVALRGNKHINIHLQAAFNFYEEHIFDFYTLEECSEDLIYSQENYWCNMLDSHNRKHGYNIDPTSPNGKIAISNETRARMSQGAAKRKVVAYTLYGEHYKEFTDLYTCAEYFKTHASNIHRKMNVKFFKKNLIDSISSKYIFLDKDEPVEEVKVYWNNIFDQIKLEKGKYKVYDCFHNYIGNSESRNLCNILNVTISNITSSIRRNTYLRTLKIEK